VAGAAAGCLAATGVSAAPTNNEPLTVVRYQLDDRLVRVPVLLNGVSLWFDVDTGAPHTCIDAATARRLHIPVVRTDRASGAGHGTVLRRHAVPVDITLGSVRFHVEDPWIYDLSHVGTTLPEDGLLGADFFKAYVVRIDPIVKTLSVFAPDGFRYAGGGAAIPLSDRNDHLFIPMTLSLANGISAQRSVRIDTGSDDAVSDDLVRQSPARRKSLQGVGLGQSYTDYSGVFSTIQIGPYAIHNAWGPSNAVPTVGMEILRRFVLTFDVTRSVLYLDPSAHLRDPVPSPAPDR
jgi:Aspartyl protease